MKNTLVLPDGARHELSSTSERDVTELYSGPLDPQLFEVPKGFTQVAQIRRNPPIPLSLRAQEYWNSFKQKIAHLIG